MAEQSLTIKLPYKTVLDTRFLWRLSLPNLLETAEMVKKMLEKAE